MAKFTKFNNFSDILFSLKKFNQLNSDDNTQKYYDAILLMKKIIKNELTSRQQECIKMYYENNMNTIKISKTLGLCPSTVWRHIKKSKQKIRKIIKYYHKF